MKRVGAVRKHAVKRRDELARLGHAEARPSGETIASALK